MLIIRLSRVGKKKHPTFRLVISEKTKDLYGDYLELLGNYDPHANRANLKVDRIKYWLSKGAQASGTVHNLLVDQKVISAEKIKVANIRRKKEEKPKVEEKTTVESKEEARPKSETKTATTEGTERKEGEGKAGAKVEEYKEKEKSKDENKKQPTSESAKQPKAQIPS